jgi:UbiD family decarboxylase
MVRATREGWDVAVADDLRQYIDRLDAEGELQRVSAEVDPDLEIGAITRRAFDLRAPAPLFESLRGYPRGHRVLTAPIGPSAPSLHARIALAMDLPKDTPPLSLIDTFVDRVRRPIPPVLVPTGPCKEHIFRGDQVDLTKLPIPRTHGVDGGPYLGSWSIVVVKDPDTGWVNWSIYRAMVSDPKTLCLLLHRAQQHGGHIYFNKYEPRNKPMPIAIAVGTDPLSSLAAAAAFPFGVEEGAMAGGLRGKAVDVVRCETVDLEVPASSEIVVEGFVPPHTRRPEGPYGEYTGYAIHAEPTPIIEVSCVTHRSDPIFTMANMGKPWDDNAVAASITTSSVALQALRSAGIRVKSVYVTAPPLSVIVSAPPVPGSGLKIASVLWSGATRTDLPYVIIVDEDIDVTDLRDVWWALMTRLHPKNGIHQVNDKVANPLIPWLTPEERRDRHTWGAFLDARFPHTWTAEYRDTHTRVVDFENGWPAEIRERVLRRWTEYGFADPSKSPTGGSTHER